MFFKAEYRSYLEDEIGGDGRTSEDIISDTPIGNWLRSS
jgi:hypothetical protein